MKAETNNRYGICNKIVDYLLGTNDKRANFGGIRYNVAEDNENMHDEIAKCIQLLINSGCIEEVSNKLGIFYQLTDPPNVRQYQNES